MLVELGRQAIISSRGLFQACAWLPWASSDRLIDTVSECLQRYFRALRSSASLSFSDSRSTETCLIALAETIRWLLLAHRDIPEDVSEGLASYTQNFECTESIGRNAHTAVVEAIAMMNLQPLSLRRAEIVNVLTDVAQWAKTVVLAATPFDRYDNVGVDKKRFTMQRCHPNPEVPELYIRLHDLESILEALQYRAIGAKPNTHYQRWLTRVISQLNGNAGTDRHTERHAIESNCSVVFNYLPILEKLRAKVSMGEVPAIARKGVLRDITDHGCKLTVEISDYQRPTIGALVLICCEESDDKLGIVRWIQHATERRCTNAGIEFIAGSPRIAASTSRSELWSNGMISERSIRLDNANSQVGDTTVSLVQPKGSFPYSRTMNFGNKLHLYTQVTTIESGPDFELLACSE